MWEIHFTYSTLIWHCPMCLSGNVSSWPHGALILDPDFKKKNILIVIVMVEKGVLIIVNWTAKPPVQWRYSPLLYFQIPSLHYRCKNCSFSFLESQLKNIFVRIGSILESFVHNWSSNTVFSKLVCQDNRLRKA